MRCISKNSSNWVSCSIESDSRMVSGTKRMCLLQVPAVWETMVVVLEMLVVVLEMLVAVAPLFVLQ